MEECRHKLDKVPERTVVKFSFSRKCKRSLRTSHETPHSTLLYLSLCTVVNAKPPVFSHNTEPGSEMIEIAWGPRVSRERFKVPSD